MRARGYSTAKKVYIFLREFAEEIVARVYTNCFSTYRGFLRGRVISPCYFETSWLPSGHCWSFCRMRSKYLETLNKKNPFKWQSRYLQWFCVNAYLLSRYFFTRGQLFFNRKKLDDKSGKVSARPSGFPHEGNQKLLLRIKRSNYRVLPN